MQRYDISVMVLTYNPDWAKLKATLLSIITQRRISYEIIVGDDGSKNNLFDKVRALFDKYKFTKYKLIENNKNIGTVKNYYNTLVEAKGEYSYVISPGDMLYKENTLSEIYGFAKNKKVDVCFGNAIYYYKDNENTIFILEDKVNAPSRPWLFDECYSVDEVKKSFLLGNYILGATFLRKTNTAIKYIEHIKCVVKYVEDNTTTAFMLADGIRVYHFDEYVVWYECGSGVSTSNNKEWQQLLKRDFDNCYNLLANDKYNDKVIQNICKIMLTNSFLEKYFTMLFCFPLMLKEKIYIRLGLVKLSVGYKKSYDKRSLESYLEVKGMKSYASN